jgi:hypothetical protein
LEVYREEVIVQYRRVPWRKLRMKAAREVRLLKRRGGVVGSGQIRDEV